MGFDAGRITLDSSNSTYYSGQTVFGKLEFQQEKIKKFRGIYIKATGFADVHWTTDHTRKVGDRTEHYKKHHNSHEEYFSYKHYLIGSEHGEHQMNPGHQSLPFQFHIPPHCPSSFEGKYGHIRYEIHIVVDKAFKMNQEKKLSFRVVTPIDLNKCPQSKNPLVFEFSDTYCCWCISSGQADTLVKLPVSGYVPGQVIPIEVACQNKSSVTISSIKLILRKIITFHAYSEAGTKHDEVVIAELRQGVVPANSNKEWLVDMEVPTIDTFSIDNCKIIDIDYEFKVKVCPSGCHSSVSQKRKIKMGTVPIQGIEFNGPNPLETPMPVPSILPQGIKDNEQAPSFYPGQNEFYQGANLPYPGAYPPEGSNPPYPSANPPYPGANPPYPGANPPYPGANPPYPGANPPYPGANPPYPPFPTPAVPYPTALGFKIDHSLPQMPTPDAQNTSNPWSQTSASAPEPSTPVGYDPPSGKPFIPAGNSSPYNPDFMK